MNDFLPFSPKPLSPCTLVLGLLVGSFINVLVWRLPKVLELDWQAQARELLELPPLAKGPVYNLLLPRSHCPHCQHSLRPWENIPLLSYLLLHGKCSHCKTAIRADYPATELTCGLLSAFIAWHFGFSAQAGWMLSTDLGVARHLPDRPQTSARARCVGAAVALAGVAVAVPVCSPACRKPYGAQRWAMPACGAFSGCSNCSPARTAWATATSSCWPCSGHGAASRFCR